MFRLDCLSKQYMLYIKYESEEQQIQVSGYSSCADDQSLCNLMTVLMFLLSDYFQ